MNIKKFKEGVLQGLGIVSVLTITGIAYASFTWIVQTNVIVGDELSATAWNDMLNNQNYLKQEVEDISVPDITGKLDKAGDNMTGVLGMGTNKITNLGAPTEGADATTKTYVDGQIPNISGKLDKTGDTMAGQLNMGTSKITNLGAPTASTDAATKAYTDSVSASGEGRYQISCSGYGVSDSVGCIRIDTITGVTDCKYSYYSNIGEGTWANCIKNPW